MDTPSLAMLVSETKELSTLEVALQTAGVYDVLDGTQGPFTVFAPVDAAFDGFAEAYPDLFSVLLSGPWELHLLDLLFSHVIDGAAVFSYDLSDGDEATTESGQEIAVRKDNSTLCITPSLESESCVVVPDILASNGVAHVVDGECCLFLTSC